MRIIHSLCLAGISLFLSQPILGSDTKLLHPLAQEWECDSLLTSGGYTNAMWWQQFKDPVLDSLISIGQNNNYNLLIAERRISIAKAELGMAQAGYYPTIGINLGYERSRHSGNLSKIHGPAETSSYFSGTATMSWEIDVFGKIRQQTKSKKASVSVSRAEYAGAMISLEAEIANAYISLLSSREQWEVATQHAESQLHIVKLTEARHETGLASKLDVAQAKTTYYSTTASIPLLEASVESSINALAVLLGLDRSELPSSLFEQKDLPDYHQIVYMGVPADLLRRRPDIVAAEKNIDSAAASLGFAKKEYLPSLSLQGSIGTMSHDLGDLGKKDSFTYSIAPTLSWTVFSGLSRRYSTLEARENLETQIDNYNLTVLGAVEEVRNAVVDYSSSLKYISGLENMTLNAQEATRLSVDLYKQGLTAFTNVDNAELNYLSAENNLVEARKKAIMSLINLYKALGGGWDINLQ